jgi:hypothetical protein
MDLIEGYRWLAQELTETIEGADISQEAKAHLLGASLGRLVRREAELLELLGLETV